MEERKYEIQFYETIHGVVEGDDLKMPQFKIAVKETIAKDGEEMVSTRNYYLTPFRGYRFQVSGSTNGDGDYGSSPVIGLGHILDIKHPANDKSYSLFSSNSTIDGIKANLLKGQATVALLDWSRRFDEALSASDINEMIWSTDFNDFINECLAYLTRCCELRGIEW